MSSGRHQHNNDTYMCVVCDWSAGRRRDKYYPRHELYEHFRTPKHMSSWQRWLFYVRDQDLGGDYIEEWLQQHQLLQLHRAAIANPIR